MNVITKLKISLAAGTAAAVMIASLIPFESTSCLFFPSFIISACSRQTEEQAEEETTYSFALFDLIRALFG